ncbi:MAG TPA: PAS domain S-box protein, partial [Gemmatimonadaceae bacterium]|nr:PAS domain S-box protein [Gemmatimonadaceae bacterium]
MIAIAAVAVTWVLTLRFGRPVAIALAAGAAAAALAIRVSGRRAASRGGTERGERLRGMLAAIVESSDDAVVSKSLDGVITSWNAGAERIFGWTAAEAVGRSVALIIPPERRDEETIILERLRGGGHVEHFETVRLRKDGARIDVSVTISPIRDGNGNVTSISKVARDITRQKRQVELQRCVADAQRVLGSSLDYEATLPSVARLVVPCLGNWCVVHVMDERGDARPVAVAHTDPRTMHQVLELNRRHPLDRDAEHGVARVLRSGRLAYVPDITDAMLQRVARDDEQRRMLRALAPRSAIIVPL